MMRGRPRRWTKPKKPKLTVEGKAMATLRELARTRPAPTLVPPRNAGSKARREMRRAFVEERRLAAEAEGRSYPPDAAFVRDVRNRTYRSWIGKAGKGGQNKGYRVAAEWMDQTSDGLGFERFVIDMGERPDGCEAQVDDPDRPFGPGNVRWGKTLTDPRGGGPALYCAPDAGLTQERAKYAARLVDEDATGRLAEYREMGLFVRDADTNYLYSAWKEQLRRCCNPRFKAFKQYGGRGIRMHEDWRCDFETYAAELLLDIGPRPTPDHSLDRIDNDGDYQRGNLRWATTAEQNANRRKKADPEGDARRAHEKQKAEMTRLGIEFEPDGTVIERPGDGWTDLDSGNPIEAEECSL